MLTLAGGGCEWNAEGPSCMSAKHEKELSKSGAERFDAAEATALQVGTRLPVASAACNELHNDHTNIEFP